MINRKQPPAIKDAVDYSLVLKPYEHYTLDNGIEVYAVNAGAQEVMQLELVYFAGNSFETQKGVAAVTNFLLKNGTADKSAYQINEAFEYYGAYCSRACYNETAVVSLHCLTKHIGPLLPVLEDMLTNSIFSEEELAIYKQNSLQRLRVNLQKCEFVAARLIDSYLYGEQHPYGKYTLSEDIEALTVSACREFYQQHYLNGKCIIFVAGNLPGDLRDRLNENFGQKKMSVGEHPVPVFERMLSTKKKYRIQNDPNAVQGAIRLAIPFPNRHHPDFKKVMVLNTVFGGYFGSRLMSNIREEKGYTYGIYSYIQNHLQDTAWLISTEAGKDVAEATIEEIYKEMRTLSEAQVDAEELMLVKNYMIGSTLGDLDGPFHIIARWKNIILNGLDENYFYENIQTVKNITPEELNELAKKYLIPDNFYELVVY